MDLRAPAARRRAAVRPPALDGTRRAALRRIRELLHSGDTGSVEQALELVRSLSDPELCAHLLWGVQVRPSAQDERLCVLHPGRIFAGAAEDARLRWALHQVFAEAPAGSAAAALRASITALQVAGPVVDAATLQALPALRSLRLDRVKRLDRAEVFPTLVGLRALELYWCRLPPEVGLPPGLERLDIEHYDRPDLALLAPCARLEDVRIRDAARLAGLGGLEGASGLRELRLQRAESLSDLSALRSTTALERLVVAGAASLQALAGLEAHPSLRALQVEQAPYLRSLADLRGCARLEQVELRGCGALRSLAGCTGLRRLSLEGMPALSDLGGIEALGGLEELELSGCAALPDLSALAGLPSLRTVRLAGPLAPGMTLDPLATLPRLEALRLSPPHHFPAEAIPASLREHVRWQR